MKQVINIFSDRAIYFALFISFILLAGCKIEFKNEVWLNSDASGKALIVAEMELSYTGDESSYTDLYEVNALQDYIDLIEKTDGATLLNQNVLNSSDNESQKYTYSVEFEFDKIETLNKIISVSEMKAYSLKKVKKVNSLSFNPNGLSMLDMGYLKDFFSDLEQFYIDCTVTIHTPAKIKETDAKSKSFPDEKSIRMEFKIDESWYSKPAQPITIKY